MPRQHITHLINPYLDGYLDHVQRARVVNHARVCETCRAALARRERIASDMARELPALGYAPSGQLATVFAGVMQDVQAQRWRDRLPVYTWLPGVTVAAMMLLVIAVVLSVLGVSEVRVEAAPAQTLRNLPVSTASPTRGAVETEEALPLNGAMQATVAFASDAARDSGATPAPAPGEIRLNASPEARSVR